MSVILFGAFLVPMSQVTLSRLPSLVPWRSRLENAKLPSCLHCYAIKEIPEPKKKKMWGSGVARL